jgi:hypothetical protein
VRELTLTQHPLNKTVIEALRANRAEYKKRDTAITGFFNADGTINYNPIAGLDPGYIWLHYEDARSAFRAIVGDGMHAYTGSAGVRVRTGFNDVGEIVALGAVADSVNAPIIDQLQQADKSNIYLESSHFKPGLLRPWVEGGYGLMVYVEPLTHAGVVIGDVALDVSAYVPATSGYSGLVVVYYDVSAAALGAVAGTTSALPASSYSLTDVVAIALGDTDRIRLGALLLTNGQTTIASFLTSDGSPAFFEGRDWLTLEGGGGGGGGINVTVRVVTAAGAITVTNADYVVVVNKTVGAATTVNLPGSPTMGDCYVIKDSKGDAATNNITLTPAAGTIDGAGTYVMSVNRESISIVYTGSEWAIV